MNVSVTDPFGGIGAGWTLQTVRSLGNPSYPGILWRTLWLSATFRTPTPTPLVQKVPPWLVERLLDTLGYAA